MKSDNFRLEDQIKNKSMKRDLRKSLERVTYTELLEEIEDESFSKFKHKLLRKAEK